MHVNARAGGGGFGALTRDREVPAMSWSARAGPLSAVMGATLVFVKGLVTISFL